MTINAFREAALSGKQSDQASPEAQRGRPQNKSPRGRATGCGRLLPGHMSRSQRLALPLLCLVRRDTPALPVARRCLGKYRWVVRRARLALSSWQQRAFRSSEVARAARVVSSPGATKHPSVGCFLASAPDTFGDTEVGRDGVEALPSGLRAGFLNRAGEAATKTKEESTLAFTASRVPKDSPLLLRVSQ
jgi:hypothetical protein